MVWSTWAAALLWPAVATVGHGQAFDDDFPAAGLVGEFHDANGNRCRRVDERISFVWHQESPDPRIGEGHFQAVWRGQVLLRASGRYQLQAYAEGDVRVLLDGDTVLHGSADKPSWIAGTPTDLQPGFRDVVVQFAKTQPAARLTLYWSGPDFQLEPMPPSSLYHEHADAPNTSFDRGRSLVDALRCTACHEIPTALPHLPAPALDTVAGNLSADWIAAWLSADAATDPQPLQQRRMPHFDLSAEEGRAIAAYLTSARSAAAKEAPPQPSPPQAKRRAKSDKPAEPNAKTGEHLFVSLGCLACHQHEGLGTSGLFGGTDLSRVGEKRTENFFRRWLTDPAQINRHHRMPVFELSADETAHLARFLSTRVDPDAPSADALHAQAGPQHDQRLIQQGRRLAVQHRCNACHTMPETTASDAAQHTEILPDAAQQAITLTAAASWQRACAVPAAADQPATPARTDGQPVYRLTTDDLAAIRHYVEVAAAVQHPRQAVVDGADLLTRSNCLACHPRGLGTGISETALPIADRYADAVEHVAALVPPSLNSIGDKLHEAALRRAIERTDQRRRPWLAVRMPRYPLRDDQFDQLVRMFVEADRIPDSDHQQVAQGGEAVGPSSQDASRDGSPAATASTGHLSDAVLNTVGARLVTSDGFGCVSCHAMGGVQPGEAPINARGPDLTGLGERIRADWFRRWVSNPLRIVPRVEMPAIAIPVPGVLDESLTQQIDAVWQVLNLEGFKPPKPNPVRIVRRQGIESADQPAAVLTDVLRLDEAQWIKPLLIGLPNRHNVLIDLQDARLDGWWIGDTARQYAVGKTWFWEATAQNLWQSDTDHSDLALVTTGSAQPVSLTPTYQGQFRTELDQWRHVPGGVAMDHRLHFGIPRDDESGDAADDDAPRWTVNVQQTITALFAPEENDPSGWQRTIRLTHVPPSYQVRVQAAPTGDAAGEAVLSADRLQLRLPGAGGVRVQLVDAADLRLDASGNVLVTPDATGTAQLTLRYTTSLPVDQFPMPAQPVVEGAAAQPQPLPLQIAPGFSAIQLPLPDAIMPTGFAWEADGDMVVTSLEGRVWRARDTDGDGLADDAAPISDDLATPFGVATGDGYLDVINKYALLRLWDDDQDGDAERTQTLASGWGHTADYHDWALGLPRTDDGGYWVTLSCQQDERSDAAAHLRGTVIQLIPRQPSRENPHHFSIRPFTAGHRFPIGIAVNRAGDAFVPDNQGNYNPFNELNHLQKGARYGFINRNEKRPGFDPPLTPPAINIPHPWTRSVNGICFLYTPGSTVPTANTPPGFGPFEGHMVGCEYDTQRLIRMSLERVGGTYQGAAYPLTYNKPVAGPPLLGPISCAIAPDGQLVIGNMRDSGWGGGQNTGNVVQMRMDPRTLPAGIAEVTALPDGFRIALTGRVSPQRAADPANYNVASYTRVSTPQYGGEDQQRRAESIKAVDYDDRQNAVTIQLAPLRKGFVYEFQLANLTDEAKAEFFPAEAFYTLHNIPAAKQ